MRLCVFCGASPGRDPGYLALARSVGAGLAARGIGVVYGGGRVGLMGAVADAALEAGGEVIGVIPTRLVDRELAHRGLTDLRVVDTLHARKALMAELSDGFIALPGGFGTLEELTEVVSWAQLDLHAKPIGLLGPDGYWDGLVAWLDHVVVEGFIATQHRGLVAVDPDLDALLDRFSHWSPPASRWTDTARGLSQGVGVGFGAFVGFGVGQGVGGVPGGENSVAATARIFLRSGTCDWP